MQKSKIVEIDGIFVGAAIELPNATGWRFVAADARAGQADGQTAPTLQDACQLARRAFFSRHGQGGAPQTAAAAADTPRQGGQRLRRRAKPSDSVAMPRP